MTIIALFIALLASSFLSWMWLNLDSEMASKIATERLAYLLALLFFVNAIFSGTNISHPSIYMIPLTISIFSMIFASMILGIELSIRKEFGEMWAVRSKHEWEYFDKEKKL
jgi:hypothetical protein